MKGILLGALALGAVVGVAGAQQPGGWLPEWLGGKPALTPADKPDLRPDKMAKREKDKAVLERALLRRQAVCLKLKQIALDSGNTTLYDEAERLDALAWELHQQRSGQLLGAGSGLDKPKIDDLDETRELVIEAATKSKPKASRGGLDR